MHRDENVELRADDLKCTKQRVENSKKIEQDDPDLISSDDSGASTMAQKLASRSSDGS
jgi:hypothetical protein